MAYASRFQQQCQPSPKHRGMNFGIDMLHTRRKEEKPHSATAASELQPNAPQQKIRAASPQPIRESKSVSRVVSRQPESRTRGENVSAVVAVGSKGASLINRGDLSVFSEKLRALMVVREQVEQLAFRHKQEEMRLAAFMKNLLRGAHAIHSDDSSTKEQLVSAIAERDRAITALDQFRKEGNEVMTRMHQSLLTSHSQHEQNIKAIELLTTENKRLRDIVIDVYGGRDDEELENSSADTAKRTIVKLHELLQGADAVNVNLRAHNEELLKQNRDYLCRERQLQEDDVSIPPSVGVASPGSESIEEAGSNGEVGGNTVPSMALIESLRAELRKEKRQRLEAEEASHHIFVEHTKNVKLLEQRLQHRNTPKETPRRSMRIGSPNPTLAITSPVDRRVGSVTAAEETELFVAAKEFDADDLQRLGSAVHSRNASCTTPDNLRDDSVPQSQHARNLQAIEEELQRVTESLKD